MKNLLHPNNIYEMSKNLLYSEAKRLAREIGINLTSRYVGTSTDYWRLKVEQLRNQLRTTKFKLQLLEAVKKKNIQKRIKKLINESKFNEILKDIVDGIYTLTNNQATDLWRKIMESGRYILSITGTNFFNEVAVNQTTQTFISSILTNGLIVGEVGGFGSDTINNINIQDITELTIRKLPPPQRTINNKNGRFFPYINTTNLDLSKYQVFNQEQAYNKKILKKREHCLIHTLLQAGIKKSVVNGIKLQYEKGTNIKKKDLKNIADLINHNIILYYLDDNNKTQNQKYKPKQDTDKKIEICIYKEHYFIKEDTIYSNYFIKNYEELKDIKDPYNITNKSVKKDKTYYTRNDKNKINSLILLSILLKNGHFNQLDFSRFEENNTHKELKEHIYLENMEFEQSEVLIRDKPVCCSKQLIPVINTGKDDYEVFYADCESFVKENPHKLYLLGFVGESNDIVNIYNVCDPIYNEYEEKERPQQLVYNFLKFITNNGKRNCMVYFHNLKYDYHLLEQFINISKKTEKDGQIYSVEIVYNKAKIELRDSYKLAPFALSKFGKEFNLDMKYRKKEAIAYKYYDHKNNNKIIKTSEYNKLLSYEERDIFKNEIRNESSYDPFNDTFNPTSYYYEYLKLDCLVLKKGLTKFNSLIQEITKDKCSIYNSLTISSLTDSYMKIEGAYDGVYEILGNLREYVSQAVYGGRVAVNKKYEKKLIEGEISDYDGVSLYPSAIYRLCKELGLPKGKAKRLTDLSSWESMTYAIMTVKITKVNKEQQIPFIAHKGKGVINYLNEPPTEPVVIDTITLQDYIKFHEIEYEVLDGVYWNEGGNKRMGEVIAELYSSRLQYKKSNPALANTIKLMLNSAYGKTIMKKSKDEKNIVNYSETKKFDSYIYNNFNTIKSYRQINKYNYEVEQSKADCSYNRGHIGALILSYSKRIMNEVFDIANTNEYPIYYTDTDSIHIDRKNVKPLEDKYKEIYNKELNGKQLGQFHTDFNLEGATSEIVATKSIFLGKKSYMDYLEATNEKGEKINGFHIRLKGITEAGLEHTAKEYKDSYLGLYKDLAKGVKKKFVLNPFNEETHKNKVLFEFKEGRVLTKKEFIRELKF